MIVDESDERLDQLRRVLNRAHGQCEKADRPLIWSLQPRDKPYEKNPPTQTLKPKTLLKFFYQYSAS